MNIRLVALFSALLADERGEALVGYSLVLALVFVAGMVLLGTSDVTMSNATTNHASTLQSYWQIENSIQGCSGACTW
jgi:hypothetical protein